MALLLSSFGIGCNYAPSAPPKKVATQTALSAPSRLDTTSTLSNSKSDIDTFRYCFDGKFVENELVLAYTEATLRLNDVTFPLTDDGWQITKTRRSCTIYTTQDFGFDRAYVTRFPVTLSDSKVSIGNLTFYKAVPSIIPTSKLKYLDANTVEVKKGQTLTQLAKDNNTTVEKLIQLNGSKAKSLHPGDQIRTY